MRLIQQPFLLVKCLLACGEHKAHSTIAASKGFVFELHVLTSSFVKRVARVGHDSVGVATIFLTGLFSLALRLSNRWASVPNVYHRLQYRRIATQKQYLPKSKVLATHGFVDAIPHLV